MALPRRKRSPMARLIVLAFAIGLLCLAALGVAAGRRIYYNATALTQRLDRLTTLGGDAGSLNSATLGALRSELAGGRDEMQALRRDLSPLLSFAGRLAWLPSAGPSLAALPHLVAMAEDFMGAGLAFSDAAAPLLDAMNGKQAGSTGDVNPGVTERLLGPLLASQARFAEAQEYVERAAAARNRLDASRLHPALARQLARLDKYLPALRAASQGATVAPILLGAVRPMTYLLIAQNNDELRPTGGFISAVGVLTLDRGKITRLDITDSGAVDNWTRDHPAPPEPLLRYMESQLWVMRDANFWPDFPTSAKALEYFADLDLDLKPDGVITVDQLALQILVGGLGSVTVPEYNNDVLTRENTIAKIREYWQPPPEFVREVAEGDDKKWLEWLPWHDQRKQFMTHLVQAIQARIEGDALSIDIAELGKAVLEALDEKHILVYLRQPLGGGLTDAGWGGNIPATTGDYLQVVDTNMGFNKANGVMARRIDYSVQLDGAGLARSQVIITHQNTSTRDVACLYESYYEGSYDLLMNRCYWNYLRVYVPADATLISDENGNEMENAGVEAGKQVWARWQVIPTRATQQTSLGYYQARPIMQRVADGWEYRLLVQKQAGTDRTPLHVTVSLPAGMRLLSASPAPVRVDGNLVEFASNLATDQEFRLLMR
jgi:hypothetical protein